MPKIDVPKNVPKPAEADPTREPRWSYAPPNEAARAAEADIARLKETLEGSVLSDRDRAALTHQLIEAENARGRALNPGLFR